MEPKKQPLISDEGPDDEVVAEFSIMELRWLWTGFLMGIALAIAWMSTSTTNLESEMRAPASTSAEKTPHEKLKD